MRQGKRLKQWALTVTVAGKIVKTTAKFSHYAAKIERERLEKAYPRGIVAIKDPT